ncbi:MAG TPA: NTP transferase domain-containing protein [Polyangiaceae bacterium]|nr:NTP transferase domain-containing protein [Polyangiaceae bacterium]
MTRVWADAALIFTGGRSQRMGRDKALLSYDGHEQLARMVGLSRRIARSTVVSCRAEQAEEYRARLDASPLSWAFDGPEVETPLQAFGAMLADLADGPIVCLCVDQPLLEAEAIEQLLGESTGDVVCFGKAPVGETAPASEEASRSSAAPVKLEPFPSLWRVGPVVRLAVEEALRTRSFGWQKLLRQLDVRVVEPREPRWLDNVNTPEEAQAAECFLRSHSSRNASTRSRCS